MLDENRFNEAQPEAFQYVLLPVSAKYLEDGTGTAAWDLEFVFVSAASTTHQKFDCSVVGPNLHMACCTASQEGKIMISVNTDDRCRTSLGKILEANRDYRVSVSPHGTVSLEPVTTISDYERSVLAISDLSSRLYPAAATLGRGEVRPVELARQQPTNS